MTDLYSSDSAAGAAEPMKGGDDAAPQVMGQSDQADAPGGDAATGSGGRPTSASPKSTNGDGAHARPEMQDDIPAHVDGPFLDRLVTMAAVQSACVAITDAAQHLRRTTIMTEAAIAMALRRSCTSVEEPGWLATMNAAEHAMRLAVSNYREVGSSAMAAVREAISLSTSLVEAQSGEKTRSPDTKASPV